MLRRDRRPRSAGRPSVPSRHFWVLRLRTGRAQMARPHPDDCLTTLRGEEEPRLKAPGGRDLPLPIGPTMHLLVRLLPLGAGALLVAGALRPWAFAPLGGL